MEETKRIWEIDFLRAVAVIIMVMYHFIFDLIEFMGLNVAFYGTPIERLMSCFGYIFIFISGISSSFDRRNLKRGISVILWGMLITIITLILYKDNYIRFGILHLIGMSKIIYEVIKGFKKWVLFLIAVFILLLGIYFNNIYINTALFIPLGITYREFKSFDYYPLVPYFSYFIFGVLFKELFYKEKKSIFNFKINIKIFNCISKNSLKIYILHQPIIMLILYILRYFSLV